MSMLLESLKTNFIDQQDQELEEMNVTGNLDGGLGQPRTPYAFQKKPKSAKDKAKLLKLKGSVPYTTADKTNLWFKKIENVMNKTNKILGENSFKDFFKRALDREGKSLGSMSDMEKKQFFNKIDAQWKAKNESFLGKIYESTPIQKLFRKIGWAGESWTPREFATQIKNLSDEQLKEWHKLNKGIPNTPLAFQQKLIKIEMQKRGLL